MVKRLFFPDESRAMGIHVVGSKGSGKSRLTGRIIAWLDSYRGIPTAIMDPNGGLIDSWLDQFSRLPASLQRQMASRVKYVDIAGATGWVVPAPLYFRVGNESFYTISQRFLEVVRRQDAGLMSAPILGWNSVFRIGSMVGIALAASDLQITEAEDLIRDPKMWAGRLSEAVKRHPEVEPAVTFVTQDFPKLSPQEQDRQIGSLLTKIAPFRLDPAARAVYGASKPGIDWAEVVSRNQTVLLDFRHVQEESKRFALQWTFSILNQFMKGRGPGRHKPFSVVLDEISFMLPPATGSTAQNELLAADLEELINRTARNSSIWLLLIHQEMGQLSEPIQKTLMTMGVQIIGSTSDPQTALMYARRFSRWDGTHVRKTELVGQFDVRTVEYTKDEEFYLESVRFLELPRFTFMVGVSRTEGTMPTRLKRVSIERIDAGKYVNEKLVADLRKVLTARSGRRVADVLKEIEERREVKGPPLQRVVRLQGAAR